MRNSARPCCGGMDDLQAKRNVTGVLFFHPTKSFAPNTYGPYIVRKIRRATSPRRGGGMNTFLRRETILYEDYCTMEWFGVGPFLGFSQYQNGPYSIAPAVTYKGKSILEDAPCPRLVWVARSNGPATAGTRSKATILHKSSSCNSTYHRSLQWRDIQVQYFVENLRSFGRLRSGCAHGVCHGPQRALAPIECVTRRSGTEPASKGKANSLSPPPPLSFSPGGGGASVK